MNNTINTITSLVTTSLLLSGCMAPLLIGGGTAIGLVATQEKGLSGSLSDNQISVALKAKFYKFNPDLEARIGISVEAGEVLLTGALPSAEWQAEAEKLARETKSVKNVFNHTTVLSNPDSMAETFGSATTDSWITTQIKSQLLFIEDLDSLNYSIKTVDGNVYIMGIGKNEIEIQRVVDTASKTSSVKKVFNYVKTADAHSNAEVTDKKSEGSINNTAPDNSEKEPKVTKTAMQPAETKNQSIDMDAQSGDTNIENDEIDLNM